MDTTAGRRSVTGPKQPVSERTAYIKPERQESGYG